MRAAGHTPPRRCRPTAAAAVALAALLSLLLHQAAGAGAVLPPSELRMAQDTLVLPPPGNTSAPSSSVRIGVRLTSVAGRHVSARLQLLLPRPGGAWAPADASAHGVWLEPPGQALSWGALERGIKYVSLRSASELPLALVLRDALGGGAAAASGNCRAPLALVQLVEATGVDIAQMQSATTLVADAGAVGGDPGAAQAASDAAAAAAAAAPALAADERGAVLAAEAGGRPVAAGLPVFGYEANQAAYPSGPARIPVRLLAGQLREPATLRFSLSLLPPSATVPAPVAQGGQPPPLPPPLQRFLPTAAAHGFLYFKPAGGGGGQGAQQEQQEQQEQQQQWLEVPLAWERIPADAQYRLGLELESVYGAAVAPQPGTVALHVFGTPLGTCPPGSALASPDSSRGGGGSGTGAADGGSAGAGGDGGGVSVDGPFALSANGTVIDLSTSFLPDVFRYGAEVGSDVEHVTLCLRGGSQDPGSVTALPAPGKQGAGVVLRSAARATACGCGSGGIDLEAAAQDGAERDGEGVAVALMGDDEEEEEGGACAYEAWTLPLRPGQNRFSIALPGATAAGAPTAAPQRQQQGGAEPGVAASSREGSSSSGSEGGGEPYTLTVVRLAQPENAELASITVKLSDSSSPVLLCGPPDSSRRPFGRGAPGCQAPAVLPGLPCTRPCQPGVLLSLNVSDAGQMVSVTPALRRPGVDGTRVEVNGQVLSRGGNLTADQVEDTTAAAQQRGNASFLPSAFLMGVGLQPGATLDAEVVVVAEDGVTTNRYPIRFRLVAGGRWGQAAAAASGQAALAGGSSGGDASGINASAAEWHSPGWPLAPAMQPMCSVCPAGWAAAQANASACQMCSPGTHAPTEGLPACLPCGPGTFAYSWGSAYCRNCIEGTYAPTANSSLCVACPANTTTTKDGQVGCTVPLVPGARQAPRYAVLVSFYVILQGLDPDDVVVRAGVNLPPGDIITSLIRADTAASFNISAGDVEVSVHHVARRTLAANVTATLGVDVPAGATDADISAALEVERLSADAPIGMLAADPDRFFGRTTKTLDVRVASSVAGTSESRPGGTSAGLLWGMLAPGILAILAGSALVAAGCWRGRGCARLRGTASSQRRPASRHYARYSPDQQA